MAEGQAAIASAIYARAHYLLGVARESGDGKTHTLLWRLAEFIKANPQPAADIAARLDRIESTVSTLARDYRQTGADWRLGPHHSVAAVARPAPQTRAAHPG